VKLKKSNKLKVTVMKKTFLLLSIGFAVYATSCKKSTVEPTTPTTTTPTTTDTSKTVVTETPAQITADNKKAMELQGVTFANQLTALKSTKAESAFQNLVNLFTSSTKAGVVENTLPIGKIIASLSKNANGGVVTTLKSGTVSSIDFQAQIAKVAATYTYNPSTKAFDSSAAESANVLKVLFPGTSGSTTNNAEFKIYGLAFSTVSTTNTLYSTNNAITACSAYLKVDGTNAMTYSLTASYDANGYPATIATTFTVDTYSLNYNFSHTATTMKSDFSFKHADAILIAEGSELNGTLTEAKAQELNTYYSDSTTTVKNRAKIGEFVNTATVYYQVMDIKLVGSVDVQNFTKAFDGISQNDKDNFNQSDADLVNKYCSLYGIFASTSKRIADVTIYPKAATSGTGNEAAFMLTFPDGSKADLETYVSDAANFADFKTQIKNLATN
jgi:hypothetical protein